ncbi:hypothetical protein Pst134EA_007434 [Puccinia striiformis f. sp. tritici]|uniref:hypothetical protein n=1 Tax=Puccinia striiformis f. sp. tritici TaxID=168172 RepID=UPI0020080B6B|nr:hypothetical protein Pst134EA_007434 [Puccinia striiformis f. sp. tritici]KAH9470169.1 hypothetical protein Pst134EA_007434 [Puccinia striiformis f. sp. tritici]
MLDSMSPQVQTHPDASQQYCGPRDTAYPGSNRHITTVDRPIAGTTLLDSGQASGVIWPMGPSPVPHTGGGTYTRSVLAPPSSDRLRQPTAASRPFRDPTALSPTTVSPHVLSPTTVTSHVPTASGFQALQDWDGSGSPPPQVQSPQGNPSLPCKVSFPRKPATRAKPAARAKPGPTASASINAQSFVDPPMPAPNPLATMAASPNRNTAASAHPGLVHPAPRPLDIHDSEPPRKKRAIKRTAAPLNPPPHVPAREPSPEVTYEDLEDRDKRTRLSPHVMEKIRSQPFDQLPRDGWERSSVRASYGCGPDRSGQYLSYLSDCRLSPCNQEQATYQTVAGVPRQQYPNPGTNQLQPFLQVPPHSLKANDRARQTGALWDLLSEAEQALWKDQDYLDSLPPLPPLPPVSDTDDDDEHEDESVPAPRRSLPRDRFQISTWLRNVKRDLRNMSTSHQLEGYLVLASRDPRQPVLRTVGSIMADEFLDILAEDTAQTNSFFNFVSGKQAIKDVSGSWPAPARTLKRRGGFDDHNPDCAHCLGSKKANTAAIRIKLRNALRKATHGAWQSGWPGTHTATVLSSLGVTLSVQVNDHLITAAEFCKRPSDMRIGQIGADDQTDLSDDSSDDDDSPGGDLAVASRPKKPLPGQKSTAQPKKTLAAPKKAPIKKPPAVTGRAAIKGAPKPTKGPSADRRRPPSVESSATSSSSSDEAESLVDYIARDSSLESSSSGHPSLPSLAQLMRSRSVSDASSLPSLPQPTRSPSEVSNPPTFFLDHSPSPLPLRQPQSPDESQPHVPNPPSSQYSQSNRWFLESASDVSEESPPQRQPQRLEGRARRSWTPVPCPEPWGTWHYYWPYELDLEAIEAGEPGPWDNDWVDPGVAQRAAWLESLGLNADSNEVPSQRSSTSSDDNQSSSTHGSSHHSLFDEFEYQRSESGGSDEDYYDDDY